MRPARRSPLAGGALRCQADRLRTLAQPGHVVIDEPVRQLIGPADAQLVLADGPPAWRPIGLPSRAIASQATRFLGRGPEAEGTRFTEGPAPAAPGKS